MKSTGEVMGVGNSFGEAFRKAQLAAGQTIARTGRVLISVKTLDQQAILPVAEYLAEAGFEIVATEGTRLILQEAGIQVVLVHKVLEGRPHVVDRIKNDEFDLIINTTAGKQSIKDSYTIRREALLRKTTYFTTIAGAKAAVEAHRSGEEIEVNRLQDLHKSLIN
jgi:carbamoyl-phosphate synthase large subunit